MSENPKLNIKQWSEEDRPREKLLAKGIQALTDAELIAILISSGNRAETAVGLSKRILADSKNNLNELAKLSINQLMQYNGIGEAKAISITAALELGKRRKISDILEKQKITCSRDIYEIFHSLLCDLPHEEFWVLLLNQSNKILDKMKIGQGGLTGTVADVRTIMRFAIEKMATGVVLCHNHPSGNTNPSTEDRHLTEQAKDAGKVLNIKVLDHIIVCDGSYFSFADEGLL